MECAKVGLQVNAEKAEVLAKGGTALKEDFEYLGLWINWSEQDLKVRKAPA